MTFIAGIIVGVLLCIFDVIVRKSFTGRAIEHVIAPKGQVIKGDVVEQMVPLEEIISQ